MQTLTSSELDQAGQFIAQNGRELELARFRYHFGEDPSGQAAERVLHALERFQNHDGGFGHGLEPDMALPASSVIATSVALQIVEELEFAELPSDARPLVERAVQYLERTFNPDRVGWFAAPREVNDYPHAPWWTFDEKPGMTSIDATWGNPSAELIGYLSKYHAFVRDLSLPQLVQHAVTELLDVKAFEVHELFCYLRLYRLLPPTTAEAMQPKLREGVASLVQTDPATWESYVPLPVDFADNPRLARALDLDQEALQTNLDYLVEKLRDSGGLSPTWEWGQYPEAWERAQQSWSGIKTLQALVVLKNFGRIGG